jgi:HAD superfamily hydrolase (TIGR01509 family)
VPVKEGLYDLLEWLEAHGVRTAVASSSREAIVRDLLQKAGIERYFETIVAGDQVAHGKPAPDLYRAASRALGLINTSCLALEDSARGIQSAVAAGLPVVFIPDFDPVDEETRSRALITLPTLREVIGLFAPSD